MHMTSKGQVTIPLKIRRALNLRPGDDIEFEPADGHATLHKAGQGKGRGARLVARLRGKGGRGPTTDQIMAMTRG